MLIVTDIGVRAGEWVGEWVNATQKFSQVKKFGKILKKMSGKIRAKFSPLKKNDVKLCARLRDDDL